MIARASTPRHDHRTRVNAHEAGRRFIDVPLACLLVLLAMPLVACAGPGTQPAEKNRPVDLRRSGSVATSTGAAVPLALCARSAALARALGLPPGVLRLPAACSAAGRL